MNSPPDPYGIAISTVCLSGTLEDKLARRRGGRVPRGRDLRARPHRVAVVAARGWPGVRPAWACRSWPTSRSVTSRRLRPTLFAANLRRAERKFDVLSELGARRDAGLLVEDRTAASTTTTSPPSSCTRWPTGPAARPAHRLRGAGVGRFVNTYAHAWRIVRHADHPALGLCLDSFHVLSRGNDPAASGWSRSTKVFHLQLADAPRLNMDVRRVEPPPPAVPRPGLVRPGRLRRPRAHHRLRRPAVARGVQRRLPAGGSPARRHRRRCVRCSRLQEAVGVRGPATGARAAADGRPAAGAAARRLRVHRARGRRGVRPGRGACADRARVRPHRAAPLQAGAAVAAGRRPGPAELRPAADGRPRHGGDLRAGGGERRPRPRRRSARSGCSRRCCPAPRARARPT